MLDLSRFCAAAIALACVVVAAPAEAHRHDARVYRVVHHQIGDPMGGNPFACCFYGLRIYPVVKRARHHGAHRHRAPAEKIAVPLPRPRPAEVKHSGHINKTVNATIPTGAPWLDRLRHWLGGNPTVWSHQWCARALNMALRAAGIRGTGDNRAISFARYGHPTGSKRGAIAVMPHHVGIVLAEKRDRILLLSGNHGHRVGIGWYAKARIIAYRWPPPGRST